MHSLRTSPARLPHALRAITPLAAFLTGALLLPACSTDDDPSKLSPAQAAAERQQNTAAARADGGANPHAGMTMPGGEMPGGAMSGAMTPKATGGLQYSVPEGWVVQIPSSSMRKAQFLLPKTEGDAEDAQLILFHFGGEGGSKDANFQRWSSYFTPAGGGASVPLQTTMRTVNGMEVTEASVTGTLDTAQVQGMGPGKRENWSMLVAYVETPTGPYFARLLGPASTVSRWDASFRQWIASLKHSS